MQKDLNNRENMQAPPLKEITFFWTLWDRGGDTVMEKIWFLRVMGWCGEIFCIFMRIFRDFVGIFKIKIMKLRL